MADTSGGSIILFGGLGFVGSRLASLLTERQTTFRIGDLRASKGCSGVSCFCDVRKQETLDHLAQGASSIVNLAAAHSDNVRPLSLYYETNVLGAENVCAAARSAGVRKIVFTSSVAVYGFQPKPTDENGPFEPFNEYGKTKLAAEGVYRAWADEDPARSLVIVRPTVIFGEGNRGNVYNLLHQVASGRFMMVGAGKNIKSMAYVRNVAAFLAHVLDSEPGTHIYNYVDGPDMDVNSLVDTIRRCLGKTGNVTRIPKSVAMVGGTLLDVVARLSGRIFPISAIRVHKFCENTQFLAHRIPGTGFVPPYSLSEGLARTIAHEFPKE